MDWLIDASAWVIPVVLAITLHEAAHGWMAERFGDPTARMLGRVTFNPFKHIDRFGTFVLPALLLLAHSPITFGYAKPVPVDFRLLRPPRIGMFMVAFAGPLSNLIQATIAALLLHIDKLVTPEQAPWIFLNLYRALMINCALVALNMLPILPLDGGRVVDSMLTGAPKRLYGRLERIGIPLVFILLLVPPLLGFDSSQRLIGAPAFWLLDHILWLTGNGQVDVA